MIDNLDTFRYVYLLLTLSPCYHESIAIDTYPSEAYTWKKKNVTVGENHVVPAFSMTPKGLDSSYGRFTPSNGRSHSLDL